jgi:hypothetical protein
MELFVVTSKAQEESNTGVIESVKIRIHGVFSDKGRADGIAEKYRGQVKSVYLDKENIGDIIQYWVNPGYVD